MKKLSMKQTKFLPLTIFSSNYKIDRPRFYGMYPLKTHETLTQRIDRTLASVPEKPIFQMPFRYMCQAMLTYSKENPPPNDFYIHSIAAMDLINQYIYPRIVKGYAKVSIIFTVKKTMGK